MIQDVYIICGKPDSGKISLVNAILQGKMHNRTPKTLPLLNGRGTIEVVIPRSQAMQEARKTPYDCVLELNALNKKFKSRAISVVIVLRIKNYAQYVSAIQKAYYNIKASVILDQGVPVGNTLPNAIAVGSVSSQNYQMSVNQIRISTRNHFGW